MLAKQAHCYATRHSTGLLQSVGTAWFPLTTDKSSLTGACDKLSSTTAPRFNRALAHALLGHWWYFKFAECMGANAHRERRQLVLGPMMCIDGQGYSALVTLHAPEAVQE